MYWVGFSRARHLKRAHIQKFMGFWIFSDFYIFLCCESAVFQLDLFSFAFFQNNQRSVNDVDEYELGCDNLSAATWRQPNARDSSAGKYTQTQCYIFNRYKLKAQTGRRQTLTRDIWKSV